MRRRGARGARRRRPRDRAFWGLLLLALLVRIGFIFASPNYLPIHDDRDYDRLACVIVAGGGYPRSAPAPPLPLLTALKPARADFKPPPPPEEGRCNEHAADDPPGVAHDALRPTAYRPPAWPYLLAGFHEVSGLITHDRWTGARVGLALLGTLLVGLIGVIARQLWGRRAQLVALGLGAVFFPLVMVGGSMVSETLFVALELGAVAAALAHRRSSHRFRWIVLAGVLVGLATLTRSTGPVLLLPLALGVWTDRPWRSRRALAAPAVLVLAAVLTIAPWTVRNAIVMEKFIPLNTEAGNTLAGTYNSVARHDPENPALWKLPILVPELRPILHQGYSEHRQDEELRRAAFDYIGRHPGYVAEVGLWNTVRTLNLAGPDWWRFSARTIDMTPLAADIAAWSFFAFAGLAVAGVLRVRRRAGPAWVWLVPVACLLSIVFIVSEVRFRAPIDPFVVLLAAAALALPRVRGDTGRAPDGIAQPASGARSGALAAAGTAGS